MSLIKIQKSLLKYLPKEIWKIILSKLQYEDALTIYKQVKAKEPIRPTAQVDMTSKKLILNIEGDHENIYFDKIKYNSIMPNEGYEIFSFLFEYLYTIFSNIDELRTNIHMKCHNCNHYSQLEFMKLPEKNFIYTRDAIISIPKIMVRVLYVTEVLGRVTQLRKRPCNCFLSYGGNDKVWISFPEYISLLHVSY